MQILTQKPWLVPVGAVVIFAVGAMSGVQVGKRAGGGEAHYAKGVADMGQKAYATALEEFREAQVNNPHDAASIFGVAWALQGLGQNAGAADTYKVAIEQARTTLRQSYYNRGLTLRALKHSAEAAEAFHQAALLDPSQPLTHTQAAFDYMDARMPKEAIEHFAQAAKLEPGNASAHYYMGQMYERLQNRDQAIANYREALRRKGDLQPAKDRLQALGAN